MIIQGTTLSGGNYYDSVGLYPFSTFTFTNAEVTGRFGPTLGNCLSSYDTISNSWLNNTAYFNMLTQGYQLWTVPRTGTYKIRVAGASAGGAMTGGTPKLPYTVGFADGAVIESANVSLTQGQKLQILVGQQGIMYSNVSSGGGGGTFVVNYTGNTNTIGDAIMVAGGGSGCHINTTQPVITYKGSNGNVAQAIGNDSSAGAKGGNLTLAGGTYPYMGGRSGGWTGGGGGLLADGQAATISDVGKKGNAFINGGVGGNANTLNSILGTAWGGFGGGGGSHGNSGGGGGAGGYCGGAGGDQSSNQATGGGGGSFSVMPGYTQVGQNRGQGYCIITYMGP